MRLLGDGGSRWVAAVTPGPIGGLPVAAATVMGELIAQGAAAVVVVGWLCAG